MLVNASFLKCQSFFFCFSSNKSLPHNIYLSKKLLDFGTHKKIKASSSKEA